MAAKMRFRAVTVVVALASFLVLFNNIRGMAEEQPVREEYQAQAMGQRTQLGQENGLMLGPFPESHYSSVSLPLEEGNRMFLFTDGIVETRDSSGNEFGVDCLKQILESNHNLSGSGLADGVLNALSCSSETTIGPGQSDDITLLTNTC